MMTYSEARALMASCRNKANGKPIQNNTRLFERGSDETTYYVIRLHNTDIIEIYSNGTYGLRHDGWTTVTTRQRIYNWSPLGWQQLQSEGGRGCADWYLRARASASDPEPSRDNHIEVTKPYPEPPVPGREPVESDFGSCWDGHRHTRTERETELVQWGAHVTSTMRLNLYSWTPDDHPNRAHSVVAYLEQALPSSYGNYVHVTELKSVVTDYGTDAYRWQHRSPTKYEQCPHCKAFSRAHAAWDARRRTREVYDRNVGHYGNYDAWRSAWRDDRQRVIQANRDWRAWNERNRIPWDGLVIVNSDGWPLWSEVKAVRKAQAARRRGEIAERRARERREIEARKLERFKAKVRKNRKPSFEEKAARIADELAGLREGIVVTVSVNDSREDTDD